MLFWTKGYENTSHDDMRALTGLSGSSLYNAFGDKSEIFDAVLVRYLEMSSVLVQPLLGSDEGLQALLDWNDFLHAAISAQQTPPGCLMVASMGQPIGQDPQVQKRTNDYMCRLRDALTDTLERAAAAGEVLPEKVQPRVALLESTYIGILTAAKAQPTLDTALAMNAGVRETIESWT